MATLRFLEVSEACRDFLEGFQRSSQRGRFPSQRLSVLFVLPLNFLQLILLTTGQVQEIVPLKGFIFSEFCAVMDTGSHCFKPKL